MICPRFTIHDVLQTTNFSATQLEVQKIQSFFEYFKEATSAFEDDWLKLTIVAEGIDRDREWVDYIKAHPKWEVQCHCWDHKVMHHMTEEELYKEIKMAKEKIEEEFGQKVTEFFPPKHYFSEEMFRACSRLRLSLMIAKDIPIDWFKNKAIKDVYFHFWNPHQIFQTREIKQLCQQ